LKLAQQDELSTWENAVRTILARAFATCVIMLVPVIAAAAPAGPEAIRAIPHYPNERCHDIRTEDVYQVQVCWTFDPISAVEHWTRTVLSEEDGWHESESEMERVRNGLRQSVDFRERWIIKYYARDITS
jgi:hypothetical protein